MLIGKITPKLMPVPQAMTVIQSPDPKISVTPAIYQPVPYAPASDVPVASTAVLDFSEPDLPQYVAASTPQAGGPLAQSEMSQQQPLITPELEPSTEVRNPQAAVPFMVAGRSGGTVAMQGLNDSSSDSWLTLGAIALVAYVLIRKK